MTDSHGQFSSGGSFSDDRFGSSSDRSMSRGDGEYDDDDRSYDSRGGGDSYRSDGGDGSVYSDEEDEGSYAENNDENIPMDDEMIEEEDYENDSDFESDHGSRSHTSDYSDDEDYQKEPSFYSQSISHDPSSRGGEDDYVDGGDEESFRSDESGSSSGSSD